eukprot:Skav233024  [mRNA]  locus=scaffold909:522290:526210:+ [translate_table: standard]
MALLLTRPQAPLPSLLPVTRPTGVRSVAGAWLTAFPTEAFGLHINTSLFRVLLRMRLRLPIASSDGFCPLCDGLADSYGDHARACPCGGDRGKRHNRLRNLFASKAASAGLSPELEKAGLLPPRPTDSDACEAGQPAVAAGRRPADVWLPSWGLHGPVAFDFAVTSGLRSGLLPGTVNNGGHAAVMYEERKRIFQRTEAQCRAQGLQFLPLILEGIGGGWGPSAMPVLRKLGGLLAAKSGESPARATEHLLQGFSVTLQRENARAAIRRLPDDGASFAALAEP